MRHSITAEIEGLRLRPLQEEDLELLRRWRNDTEATRFLRKIGYITTEKQNAWYTEYLNNDKDLIFTIEETAFLHRVIGSVSLYSWDRSAHTCEIGKIQIGDTEAHGKGIGRKALVMAMKVAFQILDVGKILASVHRENAQAYNNDIKVGFEIIGETESAIGGTELALEITEQQAAAVNDYYCSIIVSNRGKKPC